MRTISKIIISALMLISVASCSGQGSGNIFDDPPDCYYDSLFGCGTFDIPGDSSYYGYDSFARSARIASVQSANTKGNFSGNWNGSLSRKSSSCKFATPLKVHGKISIKQLNDRVTIKLPVSSLSSSPLRGQANSKGLNASSVGFASFCSYRAITNLVSNDTRRGNLNLSLRISCPFTRSCDLQYSGSIQR